MERRKTIRKRRRRTLVLRSSRATLRTRSQRGTGLQPPRAAAAARGRRMTEGTAAVVAAVPEAPLTTHLLIPPALSLKTGDPTTAASRSSHSTRSRTRGGARWRGKRSGGGVTERGEGGRRRRGGGDRETRRTDSGGRGMT